VIEADCIGCTKCIQACPVDAIVGAANLMHTVIESECNGCDLCVPACPVDCIVMEPRPALPPPFARASRFRARFEARQSRLARQSRPASAGNYDPVAAALARAKK
jgi:electron transport complex protein RnfB